MEALSKFVVPIARFLALMVIMSILGVAMGAFTGWAVGLVFSDTILGFMSRIGVDTNGLAVWQIGASMGFLGGFLKTSITTKKS